MEDGLVVVDAANVVGSRPDGWWRDRAGAAGRLVRRLRASPPGESVVVVLEGAARGGAEEGYADGLAVVHAAGSGDDAIVDAVAAALGGGAGAAQAPHPTGQASASVLVVTADRGLRSRVTALGAQTVGPGWLWQRLEADAP